MADVTRDVLMEGRWRTIMERQTSRQEKTREDPASTESSPANMDMKVKVEAVS